MAIQMRGWVRSIIAAGLVTQVGVAGATLVDDTQTFTSNPADVTFTVVNVTNSPVSVTTNTPRSDPQTLTFSLFNPALGTLNSVKISFTSAFNATATLVSAVNGNADEVNGEPDMVSFFADGVLTIKLTGGLIPDQLLSPDPSVTAECLDVAGPGVDGTPGTCSNHSNSVSGNFDSPSISGLATGSFIGPGTFDLSATLSSALTPRVDPDNGTDFADNATFMGRLTSLWGGSVTVEYDYTPTTEVPEPLTLYLLLAGLGGIALSRRRRG